MKIVMLGNYALYFIPRLIAFSEKLESDGNELWILQASKENLLYGSIPQTDMSSLNVVHVFDAPNSLNYQEKVFYKLNVRPYINDKTIPFCSQYNVMS